MSKKILYLFIVLSMALQLSCQEAVKSAYKQNNTQNNAPTEQKAGGVKANQQSDESLAPNVAGSDSKIPAKVYRVLQYVKEHGEAMPGYVGGRIFQNRERVLAVKDASGRKIMYQEWDVNPKRGGVNRGVERLVTGSDNRSWYTNNHYQTFAEVK